METINGVSFRDYACASANIANGMSVDQVCSVLGLEVPVWEDTVNKWNNKMAELSMDDLAFYGEVFTNPKQGKFADVEGAAGGAEAVLEKFPEWSDFLKMEKHIAVGSELGIDVDLNKEYGISITQYSQLGAHWSAFYKEKVMDVENQTSQEIINDVEFTDAQKEKHRVFSLHTELMNKWDAHFRELFKDKTINLTGDIKF